MVEEPAPKPSKLKLHLVFGAGLFFIALFLRLVGLGWGLPNANHQWSYHPDEPDIWIYSQSVKPIEGKLTPGFYNYGTFYLTLLSVSTDIVNGYGGGPEAKDGSDSYQALARYHTAGRLISALAGAAMAWVVFLILWRRVHPYGAIFGGAAVALAPGLVVHSRFQTVDVLATCLLTLGLYHALNVDQPKSLKAALLSGLFFGMSAGTKYTGLLGLLALVVMCTYQRKWKELAAGVGVCLLTFLVTTPGILLDSEKFWRDFGYEMAHTSQGHGLVFAATAPGFIYHILNLVIGFGSILMFMGIAGLGRAAFRKHTWAVALIVFGVAYFLLIGRAEVKFLRYTFPLIPVLACGAGWLFGRAHVNPQRKWRAVGAIGLLGLGGILGGGLVSSLQATNQMANAGNDPRAYVLKQLQPGTVGLVSDPWFYTPDFYPEAGAPRRVPFGQRQADMLAAATSANPILRYVPENPNDRYDWDTRLLDQKPDYVVFSSFETEGVDRLAQLNTVPAEYQIFVDRYVAFTKRLQEEYTVVNLEPYNPWALVHDLMYIRPTVWVWKRKTDSATPSSGLSTPSATRREPASTR